MEETIGALIKQLRLKQGWTQAELANKLGVTQGIIGHYECGNRKPKKETLIKLSKVFNCDINIFLASKAGISNYTENNSLNEYIKILDTNRQFSSISQAVSYLTSINFTFIEKVIFKNEEFTFNYDEDRMFSSSHDPNLEYAEHEIVDIINRSAEIPKHIMEIGYNDSVQQMEYSDYLKWIVNFIESSRALALQQFHTIPEPQIFLDDIEKAINQHAEEIAQETWQPPSKEEDEQRLFHAIYGENIPANPKKEE